jgi:hypothetical protein
MTTERIELEKLPPSLPLDDVNEEHRATVKTYCSAMLAGDQFPPIILVRENDHYLISDGTHRIAAARLAGRVTIEAEIH